MSGNEKAMVTKEQNERHRKILDALMKLPENRECADCKSKGPRWASVNLGVFLCIQCSGIHRSLGVHISKVRSATLDTWLPEQVDFIQGMGNAKANQYWEAEMPEGFRRPSESDRNGLEAFIRAKYEQRRWVRMNEEERARLKASLRDRDDDYRSRDRSSSSYDRPRRAYDPDYDRDWSHGTHANYNRGGSQYDRGGGGGGGGYSRGYDSYDGRSERGGADRYEGYGRREERGGGGRYDDPYRGGSDPRRGRGGDYGGGYHGERDESRGPPRADYREPPSSANARSTNGPPPSQPASVAPRVAARAAPVLTVPLPGAPPTAASAAAAAAAASVAAPAVASAPPPAPAAAATAAAAPAAPPRPAAPAGVQVSKTADLFDLLNVNDPAPAAPAPATATPAAGASATWAAFPEPATAAPATQHGGNSGHGVSFSTAAPAPAAQVATSAAPKDAKTDILSLFDKMPISGPFLMAQQQQQQQMAAALYAQQQYMAAAAAAAGGGVLGSPPGGPSGGGPAALHGLAGLSLPTPTAAAAGTTSGLGTAPAAGGLPGAFPGVPHQGPATMYPGGGVAPGGAGMVPVGVYPPGVPGFPGLQYMPMAYPGQPAMGVASGLDALGMMSHGAAFAASGGGHPPSAAPAPAPSTGAAFDFSSLTADALRK